MTNIMTPRKPLRLWPGVALAIVQVLLMVAGPLVAPLVAPDAQLPIGMFGGLLCAVAIVVWWLLFSRAPWSERLGAVMLMIVAVLAMRQIADESIVGRGMGRLMFVMPPLYLAPALVVWAVVTRNFRTGARRMALVAVIVLVAAPIALLRTSGVKGGAGSEFHWRWTPTPEERLLAQASDEPKPLPSPTLRFGDVQRNRSLAVPAMCPSSPLRSRGLGSTQEKAMAPPTAPASREIGSPALPRQAASGEGRAMSEG